MKLSSEQICFYDVEDYLKANGGRLLRVKEFRHITDWSALSPNIHFWTADRIKCSVQAVGFFDGTGVSVRKFDKTFTAYVLTV